MNPNSLMAKVKAFELYLRDRELTILKGHQWRILLMALLASLVPAAAVAGVTALAYPALGGPAAPAAAAALAVILAALLTFPVAELGLAWGLIRLCRGGEAGPGVVFSRVGDWFRALLTTLLRAALLILWAVPGFLLIGFGGWLNGAVGTFILLGGLLLMLGLPIRAALSYVMALPLMADHPGVGAGEALRWSRAIMRHNKFFYFSKMYPWALLGIFLISAVGIYGFGLKAPAALLVPLAYGLSFYPFARVQMMTAAYYESANGDDYRDYVEAQERAREKAQERGGDVAAGR